MWSSLDNGVPVNEIGRMTLSEDRLLLQQCWYDQGFFGRESITELLERGAREFPDTYMHFVGGPTPVSISLAEMFEQSLQLAAGLTSLGIKAGDGGELEATEAAGVPVCLMCLYVVLIVCCLVTA